MKEIDKNVLKIPKDLKDEVLESADKELKALSAVYANENPKRKAFMENVGGWNQAINAHFCLWLLDRPEYKKADPAWKKGLWLYRLAQASNFQKWAGLSGGSEVAVEGF